MVQRTLIDKLKILADAAKYDASCASSGSAKRTSEKTGAIGSTEGMGICHSYAPDGRCISLLKILLTNFCVFDCRYCVNRASSNVERARFTTQEVVTLTLDFYKRNYIEGLFLSSGIIRNADYTMEQIVEVARSLREDHLFGGYIHLKSIPEAAPELIERAGRYADRLSINVELPSDTSLASFAPEKSAGVIRKAMADVKLRVDAAGEAKATARRARPPRFAPAGQSTQLIVGADTASDSEIIASSSRLYAGYGLRRVYYSAYSPIPDASADLPPVKPPLMREHRLYQADWLLRFYGFEQPEIFAASDSGMLDLDIDPKLAWALRSREIFPVDVNTAPREALLRIPGMGVKSVDRILAARRHARLRLDDIAKLTRSVKVVRAFVQAADWTPGATLDSDSLRERLAPPPRQMDLFA
jgi:putative DNA modification/repair radical SAM protein